MLPNLVNANELPRIAVYVTGEVTDSEKRVLGTMMLSSLVNSGRYMGIERTEAFLAEIEREHETQRSGAIDDGQISALGRRFGVRFVCVADITHAFGTFQLSARIVDVETAVVVFIGEAFVDNLHSANELRRVSNEVVNNMFRGHAAPEQAAPSAPSPPPPPSTYTLTVRRNPEVGGTVNILPELPQYDAGAQVLVIAAPAEGFQFGGWTGAARSGSDSVTITMTGNATLTARFRELPPPRPERAPREPREPRESSLSRSFWLGIGLDVLGAGVLAYGIIQDSNIQQNIDNRNLSAARDSESNRNAAYIIGTALLMGGISVHIFF